MWFLPPWQNSIFKDNFSGISVGRIMFLSPPWCFCPHSANFVSHAQRTKCFPECICMFQNFNRCISTKVCQCITIFNILCILVKIGWTPFCCFFIIFIFLGGLLNSRQTLSSNTEITFSNSRFVIFLLTNQILYLYDWYSIFYGFLNIFTDRILCVWHQDV